MTSQRVTILGCGYVGAAVGAALMRQGGTIRATTTRASRAAELEGHGFRASIWRAGDIGTLQRLMVDQDGVVLCVAPGIRGQDYREVYLRAMEDLVAALPGSRARRIVYTSSTRVYGQREGEWVVETSPTIPVDEKGGILLDAENALLDGVRKLAANGNRDLTASVLRVSGIYGPGREPAERVLNLAGQARGDGHEWVNLVHRDDVAAAVVRLLRVSHHGVLNLSDDQPMMRREYYDILLRRAGAEPVHWTGAADSACGKRVANGAIKALLGISFRDRMTGS